MCVEGESRPNSRLETGQSTSYIVTYLVRENLSIYGPTNICLPCYTVTCGLKPNVDDICSCKETSLG